MFQELRSKLTSQGVRHVKGASILDVSNLSARYDGVIALENVTFHLDEGERVAIVGPNGAGKSTLLQIIAGVLDAEDGDVRIFGQRPGGHICIAYVPQRSQVDWEFPVSVSDVVMMGRTRKIGLLRWPLRADWDIVHRSLELVGMAGHASRQIAELSGGQQQRVFIAQALAQEADLILMDEPLTGLDAPALEAIFRILDLLRERGVTLMVATHDLQLASERFDRVMLLNKQIFGFGPPEEVVSEEPLMRTYGTHIHMLKTDDGRVVMIEDQCHDEAGSNP